MATVDDGDDVSVWARKLWAFLWELGIERIRRALLLCVEMIVVLTVGIWTLCGLISKAGSTHWSMAGLLELLDSKWRGALILTGLLVWTLRNAIGNAKVKKVSAGGLDVEFGDLGDMPGRVLKNDR